jgi:mannose-1-phosphate guanylyltransferase
MFLFRADRILEELSAHEPEILRATEQAFEAAVPSAHGGIDLPLALYEKIPSAPIDKAVMERATRIAVVPCDPDWTDLGSWHSIWEQSARDDRGNATYGDVLLNDA